MAFSRVRALLDKWVRGTIPIIDFEWHDIFDNNDSDDDDSANKLGNVEWDFVIS